MRKTCLNMVYKLAQKDPRVIFIGSDLGSNTLNEFKNNIPHRFFMEGICEQAVLGIAAGMAMEGFIPYVNTIATFIVKRALEQLVIDICLHNLPVRLIGNGGGLVYGPLGPTHQTLEDIAILRSIPNITIIAPADAHEMENLMKLTLEWPFPIYIRLAKGFDPFVTTNITDYEIGMPLHIQQGEGIVFVTTGRTLQLAIDAAKKLTSENNIKPGIIHCHTLKPIKQEAILQLLSKYEKIITIEEHYKIGGLGSIICDILYENNLFIPVKKIGIPELFVQGYGRQLPLMEKYGVSTEAIVSCVREFD